MNEEFKKIVAKTLTYEGGCVDDPNDHGGRTNKGITQRKYDSYRTKKNLPLNDVFLISDDEVNNIYYNDYYLPIQPGLYLNNTQVKWKIFDIGVNMGIGSAIKFVQTIIGTYPDGSFGTQSKQALIAYQHQERWGFFMVNSLISLQVDKYVGIALNDYTQMKFLRGWLRRGIDPGIEFLI